MRLLQTIVTTALLAAVACTPKESSDAKPAPSASAAASAPVIAVSAAPVSAANDPLPPHAELAKEARREINAQNYKSELDKVEKEIDQP